MKCVLCGEDMRLVDSYVDSERLEPSEYYYACSCGVQLEDNEAYGICWRDEYGNIIELDNKEEDEF